PAWPSGLPGLARGQNVIESRSNGGLWVPVRRRFVNPCAQLVLRMAGPNRNVVDSFLFQNARDELVSGQRLALVRQRDRILAFVIFFELAVGRAVDRYVYRDLVAFHQI